MNSYCKELEEATNFPHTRFGHCLIKMNTPRSSIRFLLATVIPQILDSGALLQSGFIAVNDNSLSIVRDAAALHSSARLVFLDRSYENVSMNSFLLDVIDQQRSGKLLV